MYVLSWFSENLWRRNIKSHRIRWTALTENKEKGQKNDGRNKRGGMIMRDRGWRARKKQQLKRVGVRNLCSAAEAFNVYRFKTLV